MSHSLLTKCTSRRLPRYPTGLTPEVVNYGLLTRPSTYGIPSGYPIEDGTGILFRRLLGFNRVLHLGARIEQVYKVADTGSIFVHCDRNATYRRGLLDAGPRCSNQKSSGTGWSNSSKRLLPAHQTIYIIRSADEYTFSWQVTHQPQTLIRSFQRMGEIWEIYVQD